ncbi:hypothetical protein MBLNU13_g00807t1 [Cladosporium sp. NU13]
MPSQQPPTPPTSPTPGSENDMSSRAPTTDPQTPQTLKRKRELDKAIIKNDGPIKEEHYFLDDQAMQRAADLLAQDQWINDDCINQVLEVFNPDPTTWYVATTHLVSSVDRSETAVSKHKDFLSNPPRKLLFPVHLPSMSHWTLVTYDRKHKRCLVYDPMGNRKCNELALNIVQRFLGSRGLWDEEAVIEKNPFPSVRQNDSINCGSFIIAVGLHLLHDRPVEAITPKLWRGILAAYFCNKSDPPRAWITSYLASITKPTDCKSPQAATMERKMYDANAVSVAVSHVTACIEEIRLLLELSDVQASILEKRQQERNKLIEMCKWFVSMPSSADEFTECFITARKKLTEDQLKAMPRLVRGGAGQLEVLRQSCLSAVSECKKVSSMLDQRKTDLHNEAMEAYQRFGSQLAALKK